MTRLVQLLARLIVPHRAPPPPLSVGWRRDQLRRDWTRGVEGPSWDWAAIKQASVRSDDDDHTDDHDSNRKEER